MDRRVKNMLRKVDKRQLTNNTQRALLALLMSETEWVSRTSMRIPSVGARLRDLRKAEFGGFKVDCKSAAELKRQTNNPHQTFYRLDTATITVARLRKALKGVV